uniref:Uncharacterized protein n=1 Tax=Arundo donax TaxID=35708 RepID=A0A0A8ZSX4_ARUDO
MSQASYVLQNHHRR